jgi:hypothetical protein
MATDIKEQEQELEKAIPAVRREASVMEIAAVIAGSRDFPDCRTPEKAAVRILAGREMGVPAVTAVAGIRITNGRVSMDACLMAGMIERSPNYDFRKVDHAPDLCTLEFTRDGLVRGLATFTIEEAQTAGLTKKDVWKNYQFDMVYWRALSRGARQYCAGLFGGSVYIHEELGVAMDQDGNAVDTGNGGDLSTRDQRNEIRRLLGVLGEQEPKYLESIGVKLLDELSSYEADKEIKKLAKKAEKKTPSTQAVTTVTVAPGEPVKTETNMVEEAFAVVDKKCTDHQREQILSLAGQLEPDADICREMLVSILAKRNVKKIAELHYLDASAIIEKMTDALMQQNQQPPFDPTPEPGKSGK